jgi:hypothetical protein
VSEVRLDRNQVKLETELQIAFLLAAPARFPDLRLFRRNVIVARIESRTVHAGIKGQCDLYGYVRGGRIVEIELKSATGRQRPDQAAWATWCVEWGIPHIVLRGAVGETVKQTVKRWCNELEAFLPTV